MEFLETNQPKLEAVTGQLVIVVNTTKNPERIVASLFVLDNLIDAIEKFIQKGTFEMHNLKEEEPSEPEMVSH